MNRAQRKRNLKKLMSAGVEHQYENNDERGKLDNNKAGISNYITKEKETDKRIRIERIEEENKDVQNVPQIDTPEVHIKKKHINLTRFIFPNKKDVPPSVNVLRVEHDSDDFETPIKKVKRAPKLGKLETNCSGDQDGMSSQPIIKENSNTATNRLRRKKRQQKITTAFLRNEQIFSEIAAQHSIAENFSPDEVQLAIALSRSEIETKISNGIVNDAAKTEVTTKNSIDSDQQSIQDKLRKYGFRTGKNEDYQNCFAAAFLNGHRSTKMKWANKFTALTLRDPKVQSQKLSAYVDKILSKQFKNNALPLETTGNINHAPFKLQSSIISRCAVVDPKGQMFRNVELFSTTEELKRFFITELIPVTQLPAGHLLKDWHSIPGRDLSPQRENKRSIAQKQRYKQFYEELEALFSKNEKSLQNDPDSGHVESILRTKKTPKDNLLKVTSELELITNTQKGCSIENAVHFEERGKNEKEHDSSLISTSGESVVTVFKKDIISSTQIQTQTQTQIRSQSPDLFADSDSDGPDAVEVNKLNDITIYEAYSSDDVKTSSKSGCKIELLSVKADVIVDLTEDDADDDYNDEMKIPSPTKEETPKKLDFLDNRNMEKSTALKTLSTSFAKNDEVYERLGVQPLKESIFNILDTNRPNANRIKLSKSCSFESIMDSSKNGRKEKNSRHDDGMLFRNESIANIDLTQSDQESNGKDACDLSNSKNDDGDNTENDENDNADLYILLSDDEVNYSIMRANGKCSASPEMNVESSSDSSNVSFNMEDVNQIDEQISNVEQRHDFSVLDLIDVEHSFQMNEPLSNNFLSKHSTFDLSGDVEPISENYLAGDNLDEACLLTPKKETSTKDIIKRQRAEFGILETQSEPFSQTPPHWKRTASKETLKTNESPISSTERNHSFERCSRQIYSRKFQSFLFEMPKSPDQVATNNIAYDENEFDEFDRLVYGSPPKQIEEAIQEQNIPTGLEKLLTGEISMDAECIRGTTSQSEGQSSNLTPEKATTQTTEEEEIKINNHVYTVRITNSPKPDFASQSDADLLKQLYNFGIKPLKRHQAVKLLEFIYNETHPIIDSFTSNENHNDNQMESNSAIATSTHSQEISNNDENFIVKEEEESENENEVNKVMSTSKIKKFNFQDCYGDLLLRFSLALSAELRNDEEDYIFQTNITKKTQYPLLPLHIAWFNLVCSSPALHESILMYEPIDLQEVYLFLKSLGYRYDPKDLKIFFDRRCIIFRYNLTPPEKQANRHIRNPNKKSKTTTTTMTTVARSQKPANSNTNTNSKSTSAQHTLHKYLSL